MNMDKINYLINKILKIKIMINSLISNKILIQIKDIQKNSKNF